MRTLLPAVLSTGEAAAYLGRSVKTLQRWDRDGILSPASRTKTGRRAYTKDQLDDFLGQQIGRREPRRVIAYCRVSTATQKPDLKLQRRVLEEFVAARGLADTEWVEEVGGGLDFGRKQFLDIMDAVGRREIRTIVLAHRDRLVRFGYPWFEHYCRAHGCAILALNNESLSPEQEMVQDLGSIVDCFSNRLFGLRHYRKKLDEAMDQDVKEGGS
jgi:putative resolvase